MSDIEENYATNKGELLAILWALKSLRHYHFGVDNLNIFTDHQIQNLSCREPLSRNILQTFFYKPGKDNVVANALSR